jgi:hypothetical protein
MAQTQHDSIYWVHLPLHNNNANGVKRGTGLVKLVSGERERKGIMYAAPGNELCEKHPPKDAAV